MYNPQLYGRAFLKACQRCHEQMCKLRYNGVRETNKPIKFTQIFETQLQCQYFYCTSSMQNCLLILLPIIGCSQFVECDMPIVRSAMTWLLAFHSECLINTSRVNFKMSYAKGQLLGSFFSPFLNV